MNTDLLLSLPITAVGYLLIPTLCSLLLKKDVGRGNQIAIVVTNAVVIFALFTGLKFLGNGVLTEGNAVAAIIWSYVGFIILKTRQSKLDQITNHDETNQKTLGPKKNKINGGKAILTFSFILISSSFALLVNAPKIGIRMMYLHFNNAKDFSENVVLAMISEYVNVVSIASFMIFTVGIFGMLYYSISILKK